ncbi:MAG: hypothetical protein IMY83_03155 [Chloroflexi bacterium]|nr:hypothetical protein [Chloroflexota bacterium]
MCNGVLSTLRDLEIEGRLAKVAKLTIVAGKTNQAPRPAQGKRTLLVGACTARFKDYGDFVNGCPPNNVDISSAITGKHGQGLFVHSPGDGKQP